ncbi:putative head protein [Myoviridae environmental samples]|nr:putative head protein [Myoviridae environmental samples]
MATKKPKTARAVHPNQGVEAAYRKRLDVLVSDMVRSFDYWITAAYKANPPRMELAMDALPSQTLAKRIRALTKQWEKRFNDVAKTVAEKFVDSGQVATTKAFQSALKDAGWAVEFQMTPAMRDAVNASIEENIRLIKSIPQKYSAEVQGIVMRGFATGRDLSYITDELVKQTGICRRRAATISRDQSNKLSAVVTQARRVELGLFEAIWQHSGGGREPRQSHVKAGKDKLRYDVREGAYIDGDYIRPGELINCRCVSKTVLPL